MILFMLVMALGVCVADVAVPVAVVAPLVRGIHLAIGMGLLIAIIYHAKEN